MGCCLSRAQSGVYDPTAQGASNDPSSSSRRITANSNRTSHSQAPERDLASHPNSPLQSLPRDLRVRLPDPSRHPNTHQGPWTRERLERERYEWWETRTEGQRNIWDTYRSCVNLLQEGDVASAQAVLDAAGCTCPTGELWKRIFGPDGVEYSVNHCKWLVLEPLGLAEAHETHMGLDGTQSIPIVSMSNEASGGGQPTSATITVKCRISDTSKDHIVDIPYNAVVAELISELRKSVGHHDKNLSVAFMGKRYDPDTVVHSFYQEGQVLIIMVLPVPDDMPPKAVADGE